jgi:deoxycytidine triphosphate deaminase
MYLSDVDLEARWSELKVECDNPDCENKGDCKKHVQPCSIDFCLSNVFWEPVKRRKWGLRKHRIFDLRKRHLLELEPRRFWKRKVLASQGNEYITLEPGKLLLGRVAAKFSVPLDCAGKIEGRSSYARLGLGIHCTGEFINPGYRGHMPLQIYNYSPNPIRIYPYVPICQVILVKLSTPPDKVYGVDELQSKYDDDDGGPSYWWRDKKIKSLQDKFSEKSVELHVQEKIFKEIGVQEPEIIERFEKLVEKKPEISRENSDKLIEEFTKEEDKLRRIDKLKKGFGLTLFPAFGSTSLGSFFLLDPFSLIHYSLWTGTVLLAIPFLLALTETPKQYLGNSELVLLKNKTEKQ